MLMLLLYLLGTMMMIMMMMMMTYTPTSPAILDGDNNLSEISHISGALTAREDMPMDDYTCASQSTRSSASNSQWTRGSKEYILKTLSKHSSVDSSAYTQFLDAYAACAQCRYFGRTTNSTYYNSYKVTMRPKMSEAYTWDGKLSIFKACTRLICSHLMQAGIGY